MKTDKVPSKRPAPSEKAFPKTKPAPRVRTDPGMKRSEAKPQSKQQKNFQGQVLLLPAQKSVNAVANVALCERIDNDRDSQESQLKEDSLDTVSPLLSSSLIIFTINSSEKPQICPIHFSARLTISHLVNTLLLQSTCSHNRSIQERKPQLTDLNHGNLLTKC